MCGHRRGVVRGRRRGARERLTAAFASPAHGHISNVDRNGRVRTRAWQHGKRADIARDPPLKDLCRRPRISGCAGLTCWRRTRDHTVAATVSSGSGGPRSGGAGRAGGRYGWPVSSGCRGIPPGHGHGRVECRGKRLDGGAVVAATRAPARLRSAFHGGRVARRRTPGLPQPNGPQLRLPRVQAPTLERERPWGAMCPSR